MKKIITLLTAVALLAASALALVSCKSPADKTSTTVYGFNYSVTKDKDAGEGFVGFATVKKYVLTDAQAEIVRNGNFYGNMLDLEIPAVYETEERNYYAVIITDATACCSTGIEFLVAAGSIKRRPPAYSAGK